MLRRFAIQCPITWGFLFLTALACSPLSAQPTTYGVTYKPRLGKRVVLKTPHFDIIHAEKDVMQARLLARSLEQAYAPTLRRIGVERTFRLPVVLNSANDASNAFISTLNFRSEINVQPLRGFGFPLKQNSWYDIVGAHELSHAVHAQFGSGVGFVGLLRLFSPDLARTTNFLVPSGISEGIAVHAESPRSAGGGRLDDPLFNGRFRSAMDSARPWGMMKALTASRTYRPFGQRSYLGGSHFLQYAASEIHPRYFQRTAKGHYIFPFAGYPLMSWIATGESPWNQSRGFKRYIRQKNDSLATRLGSLTVVKPLASRRGTNHAFPRWLDSQTLVVYKRGYNTRPGFFKLSVDGEHISRIGTVRPSDELRFTVVSDRGVIQYTRFLQSMLTSGRVTADVFEMDMRTGRQTRVTNAAHITAVFDGPADQLWGHQLKGNYSILVNVGESGSVRKIAEYPELLIRYAAAGPDDVIFLLANWRGEQGVYTIDEGGQLNPLLVPAEGSVHDFDWTADGSRMVFSADIDGILNLYEYDAASGTVVKLTNVLYGLHQATVSPDGKSIAAIAIRHDRDDVVVFDLDSLRTSAQSVDLRSRFRFGTPLLPGEAVPSEKNLYRDVRSTPYRPIHYLRPRAWRPVFVIDDTESLRPIDLDQGVGWGLNISGADPLQQFGFEVEGYRRTDRFWGTATIQSGRIPLRPYLSVYRAPGTRIVSRDTLGTRRVGLDEKGLTAGIVLPVLFSSNVYSSNAVLNIEASNYSQRLFDSGGYFTDYVTRAVSESDIYADLLVSQNTRDLLPNTGLRLHTTFLQDISVESTAERRTGIRSRLGIHIPVLQRFNGNFTVGLRHIYQNRPAIFDFSNDVPRGSEPVFAESGSSFGASATAILPLIFVDNGPLILPVFIDTIYLYGFSDWFRFSGSVDRWTSGGGLGTRLRLFENLSLDLRIGAAYDADRKQWEVVFR